MKKRLLIPFIILLAAGAIFLGCQKKRQASIPQGERIALEDLGSDIYDLSDDTRLHYDKMGTVAVIFGWGYNDKNFVAATTDALSSFDILPLTFPDDFKHGGKTYITNLTSLVSGVELKGIVMLGAPQNTAYAITRLRDQYNGELPYPVFSLFGQEEIDAMEATSDLVLDLEANKNISDTKRPNNISSIIENSVRYCVYSDSAFQRDTTLLNLAKMIAGDSVTPYIDKATGLKSVNHFILKAN